MRVNILLSARSWVLPRGGQSVRHHVRALYEEVFRQHAVALYPGTDGGLLRNGIKHVPAALSADVNVLTPGYSVITAALALRLKKRLGLVVHTWKVPGYSDDRVTAHGYDALLANTIKHASAVVVASVEQRQQLMAMGVRAPVYFSPVTVDANYWSPVADDEVITSLGLGRDGYVLTVGGNDRDELYGARLARELGLVYVRASNAKAQLAVARETVRAAGLEKHARFLSNPADAHLRALYGAARVVCLPTITRTNPAGLSALVETMACGGVVAVPRALSQGYVVEGDTGLVLDADIRALASRVERTDICALRAQARAFAETELNVANAAARLSTLTSVVARTV